MHISVNSLLKAIIPDWTIDDNPLDVVSNKYPYRDPFEIISHNILKNISQLSFKKSMYKNEHQIDFICRVFRLITLIRLCDYIEDCSHARDIPQEMITSFKAREFTEYKSTLLRLGIDNANKNRNHKKQFNSMVAGFKKLGINKSPEELDFKMQIRTISRLAITHLNRNGININARDVNGHTMFYSACLDYDVEQASALIALGCDVNIPDKKGFTPLYNACEMGFDEIVSIILDYRKKAKVNLDTKCKGFTPLYIACDKGFDKIVFLLATSGQVNINAKHNGITYLSIAYDSNKKNCVNILIEAGADLNVRYNGGRTLFYKACETNDFELAKKLMDHGCDPTIPIAEGFTPLYVVCEDGFDDILSLIVNSGKVDIDAICDEDYPLIIAYDNNHKKCVNILIEAGADLDVIDEYGRTIFYRACEDGDFELAKKLIDRSCDPTIPDTNGFTPLYVACEKGFDEIVSLIANSGKVNIDTLCQGSTSLIRAYSSNHKKCVNILIEAGADLNIRDGRGRTLFYRACSVGDLELAKTLITYNCDPTIPNTDDFTPLYVACEKGFDEIVSLIANSGKVNIDATCKGSFPLFRAYSSNHKKCVDILIEAGASLSGRDYHGRTLFYRACKDGNLDLVQKLVARGCDLTTPDSEGLTPFYIALKKGFNHIIDHIIAKGNFDLFSQDSDGNSPLSILIRKKHPQLLSVLKTIDIDFKNAKPNNSGDTLLHIAAKVGNFELVQYLIEKGMPVSDEILASMKPLILDPDLYEEQCGLCMKVYEEIAKEGTLVRASCGDMFDKQALHGWIERNKIDCEIPQCPKCEHPLSEKDLIARVILNPHQTMLERPFDYLVTLNCHGAFADDDSGSFDLPSNVYILVPHPNGFDESYTLKSPTANKSFEELIAKQQANDFIIPSSGGWRLYIPGQSISNLRLSPWKSDSYAEWSNRNPDDALMIDKTNGIPSFAKVSGKNSLGNVVRYGNENSQKVIVFSEKNAQGKVLTLKDIVLNLAENNRDPVVLIPFCCNAKNANDLSISCESYGGIGLKTVLENEINCR